MTHELVKSEQAAFLAACSMPTKFPKLQRIGNATRWRRGDIELFIEAGSIRAFRRTKHG